MKLTALSGVYFRYTITALFLGTFCHPIQASSSTTVQVEVNSRWNGEFDTRAIFTVKSLRLKQQCGHFTPFNDSGIPYRTANGDGNKGTSGQSQAKPAAPAAPPKTRVINGITESPDDHEELRAQPPDNPSNSKPEPIKYGELTAFGLPSRND